MHKLVTISAALAALVVTTSDSNAGKFVPIIPVSGSSSMTVFGINDSDIIVGSYLTEDRKEHGYFGPPDGSNYTTFDAPAGNTEPRAIANDGTITGIANTGGNGSLISFERNMSGKITTVVDRKGNPLNDIAQGIANSNDKFAGSYFNMKLVTLGYVARNSKYKKAVKLSIANTGVGPRALDSAGDIVGFYYDANDEPHGFLVSGGTVTTIDYPDASEVSTILEGINDEGTIAGYWEDTGTIIHGFTYDVADGLFTSINVPHAVAYTKAFGLNNAGLVAILSDAPGTAPALIYCPNKITCLGNGPESKDVQIHIALKNLPHVACVNGCLAPFSDRL